MSDQQDSLRDRLDRRARRVAVPGSLTLVRQELDLAKAEMTQKGKKAGLGLGLFGGAGVAALLALICLSLTAIVVLNAWMRDWLAALIVTLVWAGVGGVPRAARRRELREIDGPIPQETKETIKEDIEWAKNPKRSATR